MFLILFLGCRTSIGLEESEIFYLDEMPDLPGFRNLEGLAFQLNQNLTFFQADTNKTGAREMRLQKQQ